MNVLWLRRDARLLDHAPLCEIVRASKKLEKKLIVLYIYDPAELLSSTFHESHLKFINEGLSDLEANLQHLGGYIVYRHGSPENVFRELHEKQTISAIFMHDDIENASTRASLLNFGAWASAQKVVVKKWRQDGVYDERFDGAENWESDLMRYMSRPILACPKILPYFFANQSDVDPGTIMTSGDVQLANRGKKPESPNGGATEAMCVVNDIISCQKIDKTDRTEALWAKLSVYIAWGHVSLRFVFKKFVQAEGLSSDSKDVLPRLGLESSTGLQAHLKFWPYKCRVFYERPGLEFESFHDNNDIRMQPGSSSERNLVTRLKAWMTGTTGCPLVDAIMRKVARLGWIDYDLWSIAVFFAFNVLCLNWQHIQQVVARLSLVGTHGNLSCFLQDKCRNVWGEAEVIGAIERECEKEEMRSLIISTIPHFAKVPVEHISRPWRMDTKLQNQCEFIIGRDYPAPVYDSSLFVCNRKRTHSDMAGTSSQSEVEIIEDMIEVIDIT